MLYVWMMVGSDISNGYWAILGAREGLAMTMLSDWDYVQVRDFEYLNDLWGGRDQMPEDVLPMNIQTYGNSSVATVPTLLDLVRKGQLKDHKLNKGDVILFASVGAGMNINAITYQL